MPISETRHSSLGEPGRPPRSLRAHHQILEAIRRGDAPGARQAMHRHVKMVADTGLLRWAASRTAKTPTSRDARLP
ncbi:MAG TPA: FCD domain-containing protein [Streptosporangiaceae bacterium]|nr:FCD domain-containing protein [Streptosporangiaceae bacterium]